MELNIVLAVQPVQTLGFGGQNAHRLKRPLEELLDVRLDCQPHLQILTF